MANGGTGRRCLVRSGRSGGRRLTQRERNDIARGARVALAEPAQGCIEQNRLGLDLLDEQALLAVKLCAEPGLQRLWALFGLHIPGCIEGARPGLAELHDETGKGISGGAGTVMGDEVGAHGSVHRRDAAGVAAFSPGREQNENMPRFAGPVEAESSAFVLAPRRAAPLAALVSLARLAHCGGPLLPPNEVCPCPPPPFAEPSRPPLGCVHSASAASARRCAARWRPSACRGPWWASCAAANSRISRRSATATPSSASRLRRTRFSRLPR